MLYSKATVHDYEILCGLDVLGIEENYKKGNIVIYEGFQKQLGRSPERWYERNILSKDAHPRLSSIKSERLGSLNNLMRYFSQNKQFEM